MAGIHGVDGMDGGGREAVELWPLRGRWLRVVLMAELADRGSMSVAELAAAVADWGFAIEGPPGRAIARALRREVRRGRVVADGRGGYHHRPAGAVVRPWPPPRRHLGWLSMP